MSKTVYAVVLYKLPNEAHPRMYGPFTEQSMVDAHLKNMEGAVVVDLEEKFVPPVVTKIDSPFDYLGRMYKKLTTAAEYYEEYAADLRKAAAELEKAQTGDRRELAIYALTQLHAIQRNLASDDANTLRYMIQDHNSIMREKR